MQVEQEELADVEARLYQQNGLKAAIAVAILCVPLLTMWYWIYQLNDTFAPVMLVVSGALAGIAVRIYGRGYNAAFGIIAFLAHAAIVAAASLLGLSLGKGQTLLAFILLGLYVAGAWLAVYIGIIGVPFQLHRAFYVLTEQAPHPANLHLKNRCFLVAPVTLLLCSLTLWVSMLALTGFDTFKTLESAYIREQQERETLEAKALDVTSASLQTLSTEEAMRHAYAYFNGYMPAKRGYLHSQYPKSEYKAKRILSFLIEERNYARAKFVLGRLNYNENGITLIQQAADDGDQFAKIHIATEFGCYGDTTEATQLLNMLSKTLSEKRAQDEIYSILSSGFEQVCAEFTTSDFSLMYIED